MSNQKSTNGSAAGAEKPPVIGIALGGGGPLGGIYEIGALRAIDEVCEGLNLNDLDLYIGVNAGSFVAANLANQITPAQMCRIFVRNEADIHPFHPGVFYKPAFDEYWRRGKSVPSLLIHALKALLNNPSDQSVLESLTVLGKALPAGVFDNEGFNEYIAKSFSSLGRTNDFRKLRHKLYVIATDLETGESVRFGSEQHEQIPISKAIQASMAAPGVYMPVEYAGRHYMDGTLNKGLHCSVAFESGCDVVLAVNPVVPVDVYEDTDFTHDLKQNVLHSGMGNVLAQSYRTMVSSRLDSGLKNLRREYPSGELLIFEPTRAQARMFMSSVFSFSARKQICEQAYQATRAYLLKNYELMSHKMAPLGVNIRLDLLEDPHRTLGTGLYGDSSVVRGLATVESLESHRSKKEAEGVLERLSHSVSQLF